MRERQLSLGQHLQELRRRVIISTLAVVLATIVCLVFYKPLVRVLLRPGEFGAVEGGAELVFIHITEMLGVTVRVSLLGGLAAAFPIVLYQVVRFVAPGLTSREQRYLLAFLPCSLVCFAGGGAFAYFILLPPAMAFLLTFGSDLATPTIRIGNYINITVMMLFWMGVVFETPLVMFLLAKLGIVTARGFGRWRRYWIVVAFILSALITPTADPLNQVMVAVPLIVLYELGVLLARLARRDKAASTTSVAV